VFNYLSTGRQTVSRKAMKNRLMAKIGRTVAVRGAGFSGCGKARSAPPEAMKRQDWFFGRAVEWAAFLSGQDAVAADWRHWASPKRCVEELEEDQADGIALPASR
jgi:hypothetical protein